MWFLPVGAGEDKAIRLQVKVGTSAKRAAFKACEAIVIEKPLPEYSL